MSSPWGSDDISEEQNCVIIRPQTHLDVVGSGRVLSREATREAAVHRTAVRKGRISAETSSDDLGRAHLTSSVICAKLSLPICATPRRVFSMVLVTAIALYSKSQLEVV